MQPNPLHDSSANHKAFNSHTAKNTRNSQIGKDFPRTAVCKSVKDTHPETQNINN